ncbi:amino acid ABC transporter (plasmid) [Rhizobium sp. ACO-34A]|nr:transporter substrate-binding domain-containing protein [Rhizobium sp. ACO-34A]ATN37465.1 amino acid ABC transporter [Rhizobium sp. ACO-34A]
MTTTGKKLGLTLAAGIFSLCAAAAAHAAGPEWNEIVIGTEGAYPPFNFVDSAGNVGGLDVDIAKALCDEMKAKCTFVTQEWDGIIPALQGKKFDAIVASMSITPEREQQIAFSDPYYTSRLAFVGRKDGAPASIKAEDLAGKTLGAQSSTPQADFLNDLYGAHGATVKLYPTQDEADMDLANGRLDGVVADKFYLDSWLKEAGKDCCKLIGDLTEGETKIAIGLRKDDAALKDKLNAAMKAIVANGTYKTVVSKYFDFDIY